MIKIDLLKNHPHSITTLANIWHEVLGKIWVPDVTVENAVEGFSNNLNDQNLPITFVALDNNIPIGMCSLRENYGICKGLEPWLGALVVNPKYQKLGIGKMLVDFTKRKAKELGFEKLYLFAFDTNIPKYYEHLGWKKIGMDNFKSHLVTVMEIGL